MNSEVNETIAQLLDKASTNAERTIALQQLGEVLEEDYILNLPPQRPILNALKIITARTTVEVAINLKAKRLLKEYGL